MDNYFLERYERWMETGKLPNHGLCSSILGGDGDKYTRTLKMFAPVSFSHHVDEVTELWRDGEHVGYWGAGIVMRIMDDSGSPANLDQIREDFTTRRQTIMLFCHEILNDPDYEK